MVAQGHNYAYYGDYCEEHTCAVDSCHVPSYNDVPYCDEHRCWYSECPQPSMAAVGGYDSKRLIPLNPLNHPHDIAPRHHPLFFPFFFSQRLPSLPKNP